MKLLLSIAVGKGCEKSIVKKIFSFCHEARLANGDHGAVCNVSLVSCGLAPFIFGFCVLCLFVTKRFLFFF